LFSWSSGCGVHVLVWWLGFNS